MAPYVYRKLDTKNGEIRLVTLLQGKRDECLALSISHVALNKLVQEPGVKPKKLSKSELQKTLTDGWAVYETFTGRYLFAKRGFLNSWDHPDSQFDRSLYDFQHQQEEQALVFEPKYEALSYVWGSPENPVEVKMIDPNTSFESFTMHLGHDLHCALTQLRYPDRPRTLWVDAICINQDDMDERNAQIKRMGAIYSFATRTLVWLGPEWDDSTHALLTIGHFGDQVEYTMEGNYTSAPGASHPDWWRPDMQLPYDARTWASLTALLKRAWFSRVWVIQEVLLASPRTVIQCGDACIPWPTFRKGVLILAEKHSRPLELHNLGDLLDIYRGSPVCKGHPSLVRMLHGILNRQCKNPRDKVYGILGLASSLIQERIRPDYSKPTFHVYKDVVLAHVAVTQRLNLLQYCNLEAVNQLDSPSWVPNWTSGGSKGFSFGPITHRESAGLSGAEARHLGPGVLEVTGTKCGTVCFVSNVSTSETSDLFEAVRQCEPEGVLTNQYITGGSLLDAFLEVVFLGSTIDRYPMVLDLPSLARLRSEYMAARSGGPSTVLLQYLRDSQLQNAAMITTRDGFIGIAPRQVRRDDLVCVLLGCSVPMLLRPAASGNFLVVGPCFVQGLMDGESLLGRLPQDLVVGGRIEQATGRFLSYFCNTSTNQELLEDPRLPPLASSWKEVQRELGQDDPPYVRWFKNGQTGETINHDPRLLPESLKKRGVSLETFRLV